MIVLKSSYQRCSIRKAVLKKLAILIGKHLCWGLFFNKSAGLQAGKFIIKRLQHRYFPVNTTKFVKTYFLKDISERLLLNFINSKWKI